MRKGLIVLAVATALALGMSACSKGTSDKAADAAKSAGQDIENAVQDAGEAVNDAAKATVKAVEDAATASGEAIGDASKATGEYLTQSKDTAVKAAQEMLNGLEKKWQDLQATAAPTTDEAKADLQKAKDQMAQILADAKAKLVEAKDGGADAWQQNAKPALDATLQKAQNIYDDAAARFGGK